MDKEITGSILIFGGNEVARNSKTSEFLSNSGIEASINPDILYIDPIEGKKSIGIEQIRQTIKFLSEKPFAALKKAVVIPQAYKLTIESQNALLKTLEEPPTYALIILQTRTEEELLPTVLSRCQKIKVGKSGGVESEKHESVNNVLSLTTGEKLTWAENQSKEEKEDILRLLENWVQEERKVMIEDALVAKVKKNNIEHILQVIQDLEKTNVNQRLALENLVFNLE